MEDNLKKIKSMDDLAVELLGIFKDGILARIIVGKTKPLKYRISKLKTWAINDSIPISSVSELVDICNKYINDDSKHYEIVGRLGIKGENIVEFSRGG